MLSIESIQSKELLHIGEVALCFIEFSCILSLCEAIGEYLQTRGRACHARHFQPSTSYHTNVPKMTTISCTEMKYMMALVPRTLQEVAKAL